VGVIPSVGQFLPSGRWHDGDVLFQVGPCIPSLAGSQYLLMREGRNRGRPLEFLPDVEAGFVRRALKTARDGVASSGRAVAGGGLAVAIAREATESGRLL
jgi:phosphoribosylformylglycinamidine synthase